MVDLFALSIFKVIVFSYLIVVYVNIITDYYKRTLRTQRKEVTQTRFTRLVPLVEQELLILRSIWVYLRFLVGFVLLDLQFYMYSLQIVVFSFVLFLLAIVLSVLLPLTDSDYPFSISKLFLSFCHFSFGHCVVCPSSIDGF